MKEITGYKVFDEKKELKRVVPTKAELSLEDNEWLKGVSCFIINKEGKILIEKRANKGLTPGKLDLCSGHVDGNEVSTQTMIRELREELGIPLEESMNVIPLEELDLKFENKGTSKRNFFIKFFCLKRNKDNVKIQKDEVEEIYYVPMEEAFELIRTGRTKFPKDDRYENIFEKVREIYHGKSKKEVKEFK